MFNPHFASNSPSKDAPLVKFILIKFNFWSVNSPQGGVIVYTGEHGVAPPPMG